LADPHPGSKTEAEAYETQAIGRAHRQGQTKDVMVVRFLIKDTVEHRIYIQNCANEKGKSPAKILLKNSKKLNDFNDFFVNFRGKNQLDELRL